MKLKMRSNDHVQAFTERRGKEKSFGGASINPAS